MHKRYAAWAARGRVPLGFALGVAYILFSQPIVALLVGGGGVALLGVLLRAFAAGCLEKNQSLATGGPYAYTRNPLYLGSFLMGLGFALAGGSWILALAFLAFFVLIYWPVMRREEDFVRGQFAEIYNRYAATTPFFFPSRRGVSTSGESFQWARYRKNREYEAALGYVGGIIFLVLKMKLR